MNMQTNKLTPLGDSGVSDAIQGKLNEYRRLWHWLKGHCDCLDDSEDEKAQENWGRLLEVEHNLLRTFSGPTLVSFRK